MQGGVIGGGLEIAAATHVRIAEPSTFFQLPEGRRGIFVGGGATMPRTACGSASLITWSATARRRRRRRSSPARSPPTRRSRTT